MKNKETKTFAKVSWTKNDIKSLRPKWSLKKCEEFLEKNERALQDSMVTYGWEVIDFLLPPKE